MDRYREKFENGLYLYYDQSCFDFDSLHFVILLPVSGMGADNVWLKRLYDKNI